MPGPPIPASFESLGRRPFSFYPPIVNVEHNEWILRRASWTDFQVINTKTKDDSACRAASLAKARWWKNR